MRHPCLPDCDAPSPIYGNPVSVADFVKHQREVDLPAARSNGLTFVRHFRSDRGWTHNLAVSLVATGPAATANACVWLLYRGGMPGEIRRPYCFRRFPHLTQSFAYSDGVGGMVNFWAEGQGIRPETGIYHRVQPSTTGNVGDVLRSDNVLERFDATGRLTERWFAAGGHHSFAYSDTSTPATVAPGPGYLIGASDHFGRTLGLRYSATGQLARMIDPANQEHVYTYDDSGRLAAVNGPASYTRQYKYDEAANVAGAPALGLLTGLLDGQGVRLGNYTYFSNGYVKTSEGAEGTNRHEVTNYGTVKTPLGALAGHWLTRIDNLALTYKLTECRPNGPCPEVTSTFGYDAVGRLTRSTDRNGSATCFSFDDRGLERVRVEGVFQGIFPCENLDLAALPIAAPPTGSSVTQRKISTQWHPVWRLRTREARPTLLIDYVYNGQPDPENSSQPLWCAPATAVLPGGLPIAVLCKRIERATTDLTGGQGFAAAAHPASASRVHRWSCDAAGQVLSYTDPRGSTTQYNYFATTTNVATRGDLSAITNALGHTTTFTRYNAHGQPLEVLDANGVVTRMTYDERLRLTSSTVDDQTTTFVYLPNGPLERIVHPDGSMVRFHHDAAQRLIATSDGAGNRVEHTLDNAGNPFLTVAKDPSGVVRRQLARQFDEWNQVRRLAGGL